MASTCSVADARTMKIPIAGAKPTLPIMPEALIGYARCSTDEHDLTAQAKS
jgi:hypothetical protein